MKALLVGGCTQADPGKVAPGKDLPKNRQLCIDIQYRTLIGATRSCLRTNPPYRHLIPTDLMSIIGGC